MYILGLNCYMHDASASLVRDGQIVAFAEEERFNRRKHCGDFPIQAIRYCLKEAGIEADQLDEVGFYWIPWKGTLRRLIQSMNAFPRNISQSTHRLDIFRNMMNVKQELRRQIGYRGRFTFVNHHLAHMAGAYHLSGFDEAAILIIDANGEVATTSFGLGQQGRLQVIRAVNYPHSLGILYLCVTEYLGFKESSGEGKVMGLAAYGQPTYYEAFRNILRLGVDGQFFLDMSYFDVHLSKKNYITEKFLNIFGPRRLPESPIEPRHMDIAASLQKITEETGLYLARAIHRLTGQKNLCLAGGVALNSVMNGLIEREGPFERVFILPPANDAGTSLGAALELYARSGREPSIQSHYRTGLGHCSFGPAWSDEAIEADLRAVGLNYERPDRLERLVAQAIAAGQIIGWFQGRMEGGPRALGNRSILADPRDPTMKDILNQRVKHRESFRPFAPAVLLEKCPEYFLDGRESPFMLKVYPVQPVAREKIPAVVHVDGTARVQTVSPANNARLYRLIQEFNALTGVPVILNTSFNVRGEPIVMSPRDAIECFRQTGIDILVLGDFLVRDKSVR
jgi:carbamoyltransferase